MFDGGGRYDDYFVVVGGFAAEEYQTSQNLVEMRSETAPRNRGNQMVFRWWRRKKKKKKRGISGN